MLPLSFDLGRGLNLYLAASWIDPEVTSVDFPCRRIWNLISTKRAHPMPLAAPRYGWAADLSYTLPFDRFGPVSLDARYFRMSAYRFGTLDAGNFDEVAFRIDWKSIGGRPLTRRSLWTTPSTRPPLWSE